MKGVLKMAKTNKNQEPPFVKLYIGNALDFKNDTKINPVLLAFLELTSYANTENGGQRFSVNGEIKKEIAKRTGATVQTVDRMVVTLTKNNVMRRIQNGCYQFNPDLFGLGDWKTIQCAKAFYNGEDVEATAGDETVDW